MTTTKGDGAFLPLIDTWARREEAARITTAADGTPPSLYVCGRRRWFRYQTDPLPAPAIAEEK